MLAALTTFYEEHGRPEREAEVPRKIGRRPKTSASRRQGPPEAAIAYAMAADLLAEAVHVRDMPDAQFEWIMEFLLNAIQSELSMLLGEKQERVFRAFLWEENPEKPSHLRILTCADDKADLIGKSFNKTELLAWKAMRLRKPQYEANRPIQRWSRYKSIAAFPIFETKMRRHKRSPKAKVIAGLSVKSTRTDHFRGRVDDIYSALKLALAMVTLTLECRAAINR